MMKLAALALMCLVLSTGCLQPRKVADRRAAKAAAILAEAQIRAAKLCPGCVFQDTVRVAGDTLHAQIDLADSVDYAALYADCIQLTEARDAERDLFIHLQATAPLDKEPAKVNVRDLPPRTRRAVQKLQDNACQFKDFMVENECVQVLVTEGEREPLLTIICKPLDLVCPPCVGKPVFVDRIVKVGVDTWWRTLAIFLLITMACSLAWVLWAFLKARPYPSNEHER